MGIPKKPLAVSRAKKKLPVELDWGKGIPKDRLAYINADEEALIKRFRTSKSAREYAGIPAYADDSSSSKGVERGVSTGTTTSKTSSGNGGLGQGGQGASKGPSGAGQGPNSPAGTSKSPSSSASSSSGSKSPSSPSSTGQGGSKSPNAAAQAASNKLNGVSGAARPTTNAGASTISGNKSPSGSGAPNMAASYASQKLNATAGALKAAQQPQSIQGMINSGTATPWGGPSSPYAQTAPNGSYYGPKGAGALNTNARMAAARSVGFNPDPVQRTPGDAEALGRMMMAESAVIKNQYGNPLTAGLQGVGDVVRNRMLSERFPDTVQGVISQRNQFSPMNRDTIDKTGLTMYGRTPANSMATSIAESILSGESPSVVGASLNYSNESTVRNKPDYASSSTKASVAAMPKEFTFSDYRNPNTYSHTFGTREGVSDVAFNGYNRPSSGGASTAAASPTELAAERPQSIPAPSSVGMLGTYNQPQAPSRTTVAADPRVSLTPGSYPAAGPKLPTHEAMLPPPIDRLQGPLQPQSQNMQTPSGWGQEKVLSVENYVDPSNIRDPAAARMSGIQQAPPQALPGFSPPGLPSNFRGTAGVASTGRVPGWGYSPSADYAAASPSAASGPDTYSPQEGPGDEIVSDNPMQGPTNPIQEGENPQITKDRQKKYASRGATIGGVIAGPIGTIIGGTLGWQMGKTPPRQRQAIASNPQALNANVQSINTMVEERGGKGNPQMRVTDRGLKDVLENPAKVSQNPEAYTTLEQMLAALAQGIDPETGKPI